jgi:hypothetical protein
MNQATLSTMDRTQLEDAAGDYDIDPTGMDDAQLRQAILDAENSVDTSGEDEFEAGMTQERAQREAASLAAEGHINEADHPMLAGAQIQVHNVALPKSGLDGKCPHCQRNTRDGHSDRVTEFAEMSPGSQNSTTQQFTCNDCAGEWGPVVDKPKKARAPSGSSNGLKIERDRETRNGVTRPSAGGKCRGVWDMLDAIGTDATAKEARTKAAELGFDKTTTMVQFYRWRKFNGIEGRQ